MASLWDMKTEENCQKAYVSWQTRDEQAEYDFELKSFRLSVANYNKILKDMGKASPEEKKKLYDKLGSAEKEIQMEEKALEQKRKELVEKEEKAKDKFKNMTPNDKALAARAMLAAGVGGGMMEAKEMLESLERIAEQNPTTMDQVQRTAEAALGKQEGVLDTRDDLTEEQKHRKVHSNLRPVRKEKKNARDFERSLERQYPDANN